MVRDAFAYQRRTNAGAKDPLYQARDTAMKELMSKRVGGQGTVRLAQLRAQDGGFLSRVNAYWTYTLFHVQGRPFPVWPLVWFMIYSVGVTLLVKLYMEPIGQLDNVKNLKPDPQGIASILGLAVFLILTFRNNSAYQRWYDGAALFTAFCGAIGTAGRKVAAVMPPVMAERQLWWLIAALYSSMEQLRVTNQDYSKLKKVLPPDMWAELELRANKFVWAMFRYTTEVVETGEVPNKLSNYAAYEVFRQADPCTAIFTDCGRVLNTPMPFAYVSHLRAFLIIWLLLLPWIFAPGYGYYALILCFFVCYGVLGIEEAAVEVEQPFGTDENDVPLDAIAEPFFKGLYDFILLVEAELDQPSSLIPGGNGSVSMDRKAAAAMAKTDKDIEVAYVGGGGIPPIGGGPGVAMISVAGT